MRLILLLILSLTISNFGIIAGNIQSDSLLLGEIEYSSNIEKRIIEEYFSGIETDLFNLFYVVDCIDNYSRIAEQKATFNRDIVDYKSAKFVKMKPAKKAKIIYNNLHEKYFKKYELESMFNNIFSSGNYNCVTASAVYALYFDKLGFDYQIKLTPNHVYLVLFPGEEAIRMETTNPTIGNYIIDSKIKKQYVNYLVDSKIISQQEFQNNSVDKLFEDYFFAEETINLENLIGVLYYNLGLKYFEDEDYLKAYNQFEKALLFYSGAKVKFMSAASLGNYFTVKGVNNELDLKYMIKFSRLFHNENDKKVFLDLFKIFTQNVLIEKGEFEKYINGYRYLTENLTDSILSNEMGFVFSYELGRSYYNTGQIEKSQKYFEESFLLKPANIDAQAALIHLLSRKAETQPAIEVIPVFTKYYNNYLEIRKNNAFCSLYSNVCLSVSSLYFNLRNPVAANEYLDKFEELFCQNQNLDLNNYAISDAYTSAAVYYFGLGKQKQAKVYLERGLSVSPNDFQLLKLKQSF